MEALFPINGNRLYKLLHQNSSRILVDLCGHACVSPTYLKQNVKSVMKLLIISMRLQEVFFPIWLLLIFLGTYRTFLSDVYTSVTGFYISFPISFALYRSIRFKRQALPSLFPNLHVLFFPCQGPGHLSEITPLIENSLKFLLLLLLLYL